MKFQTATAGNFVDQIEFPGAFVQVGEGDDRAFIPSTSVSARFKSATRPVADVLFRLGDGIAVFRRRVL